MTDTARTSKTARTTDASRIPVQAVAAAWAVFELAIAAWMDFPFAAAFFGVLFAVGAWWAGRPGMGGVVLVAVLVAIELAFLPFYARESIFDWTTQIVALVLGVAAIIACTRAARAARRG
ncbi:hypothetical protein FE697_011880 [Mumia zhuanghuii]|uniref:SPW repeat-containing protein n=2 Tax=Mumia TaxID=1546255 RepID=A0ABW1QEL8_9ACTN|nr:MULTISPECIES: hypothetical protein [Mumia]KAA1422845.1 hypothetical protein FE697_011880 [Mumia zhuanghuii]